MKQFAINFCTLFSGLCGWAYYTGVLLVLALLFVWLEAEVRDANLPAVMTAAAIGGMVIWLTKPPISIPAWITTGGQRRLF